MIARRRPRKVESKQQHQQGNCRRLEQPIDHQRRPGFQERLHEGQTGHWRKGSRGRKRAGGSNNRASARYAQTSKGANNGRRGLHPMHANMRADQTTGRPDKRGEEGGGHSHVRIQVCLSILFDRMTNNNKTNNKQATGGLAWCVRSVRRGEGPRWTVCLNTGSS